MTETLVKPTLKRPPISWKALVAGGASFLIIITALTLLIEAVGLERLQALIDEAGPLAPLIYVFIKAVTYIFSPLSSGPIQLSAGILFGLWEGVFYTLIGEVIGGTINFLIARKLGRPVVRRFVGDDGMRQVDQLYHRVGGWRALAYSRLLLFSIYDFMSYAAGLTPLRLRTYILISACVGFVPTFIFVGIGTTLATEPNALLFIYAGVGVLSVLPLLLNKGFRQGLWQLLRSSVPLNKNKP